MENETKKKKTTSAATKNSKAGNTAKKTASTAKTTKATSVAKSSKPKTTATKVKTTTTKKDTKVNTKAATAKKTTKKVETKIEEPVKETVKPISTTKKSSAKVTKTKKDDTSKHVPVKKEKLVNEISKPEPTKEKMLLGNNEFANLIKIILIVTAIFLAFYLVTYLVTKNKDNSVEDDNTEVSIQYDEILLSNLLKQNKDEYYVLAYDAEDRYFDAYYTYLSSYESSDDSLRVYTSVISNGFNSKYFDKDAEESKTKVDKISDLVLKASTLFKINDGKITDSYEGHEAIISQLESMVD